jgi:hypothetical protein
MFGQGCVLVGAGAGDELVPDDGLAELDDDVVRAMVVAVPAVPPVAPSATPVAPAPTPAATMPVMISRLARLPILEAIWVLPSRDRRVARSARPQTSLGSQTASNRRCRSQRALTCRPWAEMRSLPAAVGPRICIREQDVADEFA